MRELRIPVGGAWVTASVHGEGPTAVVLGHGAGGDRRSRLLVAVAEALAGSGRRAVLYNFPYSEAGRRAPDRGPLLEAAVEAVAGHVSAELHAERLVLGGKSMGGRMASQVVAKGVPGDGLVFLGYPLHPPGRTDQVRDRHLPRISAPMLFVQGTRDAFARWDLIEGLARRLGDTAELLRIEGGDHSFAVPRASGRTPEQVEGEIREGVLRWLSARGL